MRGNSDCRSGSVPATRTPPRGSIPGLGCASLAFSTASKITSRRWYGPPSGERVVKALAMLLATTSMRYRSAVIPLALMLATLKRFSKLMPRSSVVHVSPRLPADDGAAHQPDLVGEDLGISPVQDRIL